MSAKVEGATIDKTHSGISPRDVRRAAGRKKKAERQGRVIQRGVGMGWPEPKDVDKLPDDNSGRDKQWMLPG